MKTIKRILGVLLLLLMAGAIALYFFRKPLFIGLLALIMRPDAPFDPANAPPAPDYTNTTAWAAHPDKADPADWLPSGYVERDNPIREQVDVFYIHPTGFFGNNNWNAAMGERSKLGIPTDAMLASQASAFNGVGRVYAPEYRQATLYSFVEFEREPGRTNGMQALELAYTDIASAFDHFITHDNQGRPFIIASHSQGTCHALRLLAEKIDNTPLHQRMIAAYLIGFGVPMDYFQRVYKNIKPGTTPTQTGCILTWDTLREGVTPEIGGFHYYPGGWETAKGKPRFCVNPLSWTTDENRADATLNKGALLTNMGGLREVKVEPSILQGLTPALTWAQCKDGALYVKNLKGTPFVTVMSSGGNYHLFDIHLFWANIRENALTRAKAFLDAQPTTTTTPTEPEMQEST